jgi:hypothetical protein
MGEPGTVGLFPILEVQPEEVLDDESLGTKPKFWFIRDEQRWLFKEARENTGEDWSEKLAAEIAARLGIPAAAVELASFQGKAGSASLSFLHHDRHTLNLIHGNEILAGQVFGYDKDKRQRQSDHTLKNIEFAIGRLFPAAEDRQTVLARLAAYLVLDGLIGNVDRHHENWGLLARFTERGWEIEVAPTFDHASSLGRELRDERRRTILENRNIERYVRKGTGGIYLGSEDPHGANPLRLVEFGARRFPQYFLAALQNLKAVPVQDLLALVDRVPDNRMSDPARSFTKAFLTYTHASLCALIP